MARFKRMLATINSEKHFVGRPTSNLAAAAISNHVLAVAVNEPTALQEVREGSVIKAVFVELWVVGSEAVGGIQSFNITVEKLLGGQTAMTNAQSLNLGSYPNKKNVLYTTQGILATANAGPTYAMLRQWYPIPKGKQRMGLGDQLILNVANIAAGAIQQCGITIYKEYF